MQNLRIIVRPFVGKIPSAYSDVHRILRKLLYTILRERGDKMIKYLSLKGLYIFFPKGFLKGNQGIYSSKLFSFDQQVQLD